MAGWHTLPSLMARFRLLNDSPKLRAEHNRETWGKIVALFAGVSSAPSREQLQQACSQHQHPAGAKGFVAYCLRNRWIGEFP